MPVPAPNLRSDVCSLFSVATCLLLVFGSISDLFRHFELSSFFKRAEYDVSSSDVSCWDVELHNLPSSDELKILCENLL